MNYPLISEYIESIKSAEDNFDKLSYLRPVLNDSGLPVMTSGNFAVVFKMQDKRSGKFYALKCFTKEQEGRVAAYHQIADALKNVDSPYFVSLCFLEKELFVDTDQTSETEFPVLLMDWVEGKTLDKYLRENLDNKYALEMLAYRFSLLAQWLIPQPFAHGDLKPDNILVREDGTLVLIDYDGMYVPAMKGQKARELGSPDFRHPQRSENKFDNLIDDFPIATILFSLNHIANNPSLLSKFGANDRLLLSKDDYHNLDEAKVIQYLYPTDDFMDTNFMILKFAVDDGYFKKVKWSWLRILNKPIEPPSVAAPRKIKVMYNGCCLNLIYVEGGSYYKGAQKENPRMPNYDFEAEADEGPVKECHVDGFWISESLVTMDIWPWFADNPNGVYPYNIRERCEDDCHNAVYGVTYNDCALFMRELSKATNVKFDFPTETEWEFAARGGIYSRGYKYSGSNVLNEIALYGKETDGYSIPLCKVKTKKPNELGIYDMSGGLYEWCKNDYSPEDFIDFDKSLIPYLLDNPTIHVKRGGCITSNAHECRITNRRRDNIFKIAADQERRTYYEGEDDFYPTIYFWQVGLRLVAREVDFKQIIEETIYSYSSYATEEEINNSETDEFGAKYSADGIKLLSVPKDITYYKVKEGVEIICYNAFFRSQIECVKLPSSLKFIGNQAFWGAKKLKSVSIPDGVYYIGVQAFYHCESLERICIPNSVNYIESDAFGICASLQEIVLPSEILSIECRLFYACEVLEELVIPNNVSKICENAFWNCKHLKSIIIPRNVKDIEANPFRGSGISDLICLSSFFKYENGLLMNADKSELIACLSNKKYIRIPASVKIIRDYAFNGCKTIEQLFLPEGLTDIMDSAISDCSSLVELNIPCSVRAIHRSFLAECTNIRRLIIHSKDIWFEDRKAFYKSESLSQIIIPQEIKDDFVKQFPDYSEIIDSY